MSPTPREKQREQTLIEIKRLARLQMAELGPSGLSLNGIARQIGLTTPALYRYYAGRDELITALIVDAFTSLAETMESADSGVAAGDHAGRIMAVVLAYRAWAMENKEDFTLIYGTPISGYHAPEELTQPPARRGFAVILGILLEAYRGGKLRAYPYPSEVSLALPGPEGNEPESLPADVLYIGLVGWTRLHGMIVLELFGHTQTLIRSPEVFYRNEMEHLLRSVGLIE
jgi:AcrR family transcriptional regulator